MLLWHLHLVSVRLCFYFLLLVHAQDLNGRRFVGSKICNGWNASHDVRAASRDCSTLLMRSRLKDHGSRLYRL